jgi:DNA-binding XRE family transcriptional regulator
MKKIKLKPRNKEVEKVIESLQLSKKIKKLKGEKWTQGSLSQEAKLAYHTIAKIESGETRDPRISTLKMIADAFGIPLEDLVKN